VAGSAGVEVPGGSGEEGWFCEKPIVVVNAKLIRTAMATGRIGAEDKLVDSESRCNVQSEDLLWPGPRFSQKDTKDGPPAQKWGATNFLTSIIDRLSWRSPEDRASPNLGIDLYLSASAAYRKE
jgi:hypothetical protein